MKKFNTVSLFTYLTFVLFGLVSIYGIASAFTPPSSSPPTANPTETIAGSRVSGNISGSAGNVTGTVGITNGGTGATTATAAINNLLPSQTANSGKFLTTDGTNSSWAAITGGIGGGGTTNYISKFTAAGTIGNSQIFDDGTSIGIGTSSDFGGYKISIVGDSYNAAGVRLSSASTTNYAGPHITFLRSQGTQAAKTAMVADDTAGRLFYYGYDGTAYDQLGYIDMRADAITAGVVSGKIVLATADTAGSIGNAVIIDDSQDVTFLQDVFITQNIGVGTTLPSYKTDVVVSSSGTYLTTTNSGWTALRLRNANTLTDTAAAIRFSNTTNNDTTNQYSSYIAGVRTNVPTSGSQALAFGTNSGGVAPVERMRIDASGNVGIGNTGPTYKLDVAGQIRSSSGGFVFPDGTTQSTAAGSGGFASGARAYQSTGQTFSQGVETVVNFQTESYDGLGEFSANRFTAQASGRYLVTASVGIQSPNDQDRFDIAITGSVSFPAVGVFRASGNFEWMDLTATDVIFLSAGQFIEVHVWAISSTKNSQAQEGHTRFTVQRVF